ncbi:MAG: sensor histidine kinase, partial [Bryobacteraceae bacterium]
MKFKSIQARLLIAIGLLQLCLAIVAIVLVIRYSREESFAAFDARMESRAVSLLALVYLPEDGAGGLQLRRESLRIRKSDRYRLTDSRRRLIAATPDWIPPQNLPSGRRIMFNFESGGTPYRILLLRNVPVSGAEEEEEQGPLPTLTLLFGASAKDLEAHLHRIAVFTVFSCVGMLSISLLGTFYLVRLGLQPLDRFAARASLVDAGRWNFDRENGDTEVRELRPLSAALGFLLSRLRRAFEREQQFFGDAAHELKTAVAIVKSTLQLALQSNESAAGYHYGLVRALDDTERLERLVSRMLQLSAIENSAGEFNGAPAAQTEVISTLQLVAEQLHSLAATRGVTIRCHGAAPCWASLPEGDLSTLLSNLLENAIQYSPHGETVDISTAPLDRIAEIVIEDRGPGIPADALPHLFERFFRGDQSRARASGGFGLGLAIVQAIAKK